MPWYELWPVLLKGNEGMVRYHRTESWESSQLRLSTGNGGKGDVCQQRGLVLGLLGVLVNPEASAGVWRQESLYLFLPCRSVSHSEFHQGFPLREPPWFLSDRKHVAGFIL